MNWPMVRMGLSRWHDSHVTLANVAIVNTAMRRPGYLKQTLASWEAVRGIGDIHSFTLALGYDEDNFMPVLNAYNRFRQSAGLGQRARVKMDSAAARESRGMHRAIAEAGNHVFADPSVEFVVFGEEDVVVSTDVLEYMEWAREKFAGDDQVLCVLAHSQSGQGWDAHEPAQDADADQAAVRLLPYFNAWGWATWRDRWEKVLAVHWDMRCDSGGPLDSGYDHHIHRRIIPQGGFACAVPDASRSQNIGREGGWASNAESFAFSQAQSFRAHREPVSYVLTGPRPVTKLDMTDPVEVSAVLWEGFRGYELGYDVGANCGQSVGPMLGICKRVVSAEPSPDSFAVLEAEWGGDARVTLYPVAVSGADGEVVLAQPGGRPLRTGQLVTPGIAGMEWSPADWSTVPASTYPARSLDSLAAETGVPDFIKVDTEGHEAQVLAGAAGVLAEGRTDWLVEFHSPGAHEECVRLLQAAGCAVETVRHPHYPAGSAMSKQHGWIKAMAPARTRAAGEAA
jgi:FkbM family methyltransferase